MERTERERLITTTLSVLLPPGAITELRIPETASGTLHGLFSNRKKVAVAAAAMSGKGKGVYLTLNQLKSFLATRVTNKLVRAHPRQCVSDEDIERRRWLLVDLDPKRSAGRSSNRAEHQAALVKAKRCRSWLRKQGFPDPVFADSGNGAHLLFRIDLLNDSTSTVLVKNFLQALSLRFTDGSVEIDTSTYNPSRLCKVYGTMATKGPHTKQRPHRRSRIITAPEPVTVVDPGLLKKVARIVPSSASVEAQEFDLKRWITQHKLPVVAEASWDGAGRKFILYPCPFNPEHTNKSAYVLQFRNGGIAAGCLHSSCSGKRWADLYAMFSNGESGVPNVVGGTRSQTETLLHLADDWELFHTPQREAYASVPIGNHCENYRIASTAVRHLLQYSFFQTQNKPVRPAAVQEAIALLEGKAHFKGQQHTVYQRVAEYEGSIYLDLADAERQTVKITGGRWRLISNPPVKFRRPPGMGALPVPVSGGSLKELRPFVNLATHDHWKMFIGCLLGALHPAGPYPVACLHGVQGSAKTTACAVFRALIDPVEVGGNYHNGLRAAPRDVHDLVISAENNWLIALDNLSYIPTWLSDAFCRLSTGGAFGTRKLYSDDEEVLFSGRRPVLLNGIEELATRSDLLDRAVIICCPEISEEKRRSEREFWREFESVRPRILGALLDAVAAAQRDIDKVELRKIPRMADFVRWVTAAEKCLPWKKKFIDAYKRNRSQAHALALEASPIAPLIRRLVRAKPWKGTATKLLLKLRNLGPDVREQQSFPKSPRVLSGILRRLAPNLGNVGICVKFGKNNKRWIEISASTKTRKQDVNSKA